MRPIFITFVVLMLSASALAQDFKKGLLYDVSGPVKELKIKSKNEYAKRFSKVQFTPDGKGKDEFMTYDDNGFPLGFGVVFHKRENNLNVGYNDQMLPVKIDYFNNIGGKDIIIVETEFDGKRVSSRRFQGDNPAEYIICVYSDETYDDHGNWVSRNVKESTVSANPKKNATREFVETREIQYY